MSCNFEYLKGLGVPLNILRSDIVIPPIPLTHNQKKWERIMNLKMTQIIEHVVMGNSEPEKREK